MAEKRFKKSLTKEKPFITMKANKRIPFIRG
jgi:hypothetical protein